MSSNLALRVHALGDVRFEEFNPAVLNDGEILIHVQYSGINYKDALAVSGKGKILRSFPLIPGIDAAGIVKESRDARFKVGDEVLVTGCGTGENFDGGYSTLFKVRGEFVIPRPRGLSLRESMILGTAGFTAALALERMLQNGQTPALGPLLVTGASGGVGSFAVQLFAAAGFEVHAVSGKPEAVANLKSLGAHKVLKPEDLQLGDRPLESIKFGGAVDNVGGEMLAKILAHTQLWGNVAAIGLASGHELHTTVMPFILRGVSLLGTSSNNTPMKLRHELWQKLAGPWKPKVVDPLVHKTVSLQEIPAACEELLRRRVQGRILVKG